MTTKTEAVFRMFMFLVVEGIGTIITIMAKDRFEGDIANRYIKRSNDWIKQVEALYGK